MSNYDTYYSRRNPGLFEILIDQSESMSYIFDENNGKTYSDYASSLVNRLLKTIIDKSFNGRWPKDRVFVNVIGYNQEVHEIASGYVQYWANSPKEMKKVKRIIESIRYNILS